jgi:hypothetical protein
VLCSREVSPFLQLHFHLCSICQDRLFAECTRVLLLLLQSLLSFFIQSLLWFSYETFLLCFAPGRYRPSFRYISMSVRTVKIDYVSLFLWNVLGHLSTFHCALRTFLATFDNNSTTSRAWIVNSFAWHSWFLASLDLAVLEHIEHLLLSKIVFSWRNFGISLTFGVQVAMISKTPWSSRRYSC